MFSAQNYIEEKISRLPILLSSVSSSHDLATDIFAFVVSKKFRKYSVTAEYKEQIKKAIANCIEEQKPIPFVWVFGGYKLWSLPESPEADWAELFSLLYFVDWLKPVLSLYKPGVWFDFYSDDVIVPLMNNVPPVDTAVYIMSFQRLLEFVKPKLPSGFQFTLNRVIDQYTDFAEFKRELDANIKDLTQKRHAEPKPLSQAQIAMIDLNVKPNKEQQHDPNWREKVLIIHDAYSLASKRRPYYRNPEKIMVLNTPIPGALAVGTTKTSVVKFWVGAGALKKSEESYREYILSPKQLNVAHMTQEKISIADLEGKNFRRINIFN